VALSDQDAQALIWRVEALISNRATVADGPTAGEVNQVHAKLKELELGGIDLKTLAENLAPLLPTAAQIAAATGGLEAAADRARADVLDGQ
jgi:hypothetical protein